MRTDVEHGSSVHFHSQGTRSGIRVLWIICWMDEAHILGGGQNKKNTFFLWGRRGDSLCCSGAPEIHQQLQHGGGKHAKGSCFSIPALQDPPWFYLLFCPWVTTYLPLLIFGGSSLALVDTLFMSNYLPISLLTHLGFQLQEKGGDDHSGFFRLSRGVMGIWVPFAYSVRVHLWRAMKVHGMIRWLVSVSSRCWSRNILARLLGHLWYFRRNKLYKKVKGTWPKDEKK